MPAYLKSARIAAIAIGLIVISTASALLYNGAVHARPTMPWSACIVCIVSGLILIVPVRKMSRTRLAPFVLGLTLLHAVLFTAGLAIGLWRGALGQYQWVFAFVWLVFCGNTEFARRVFLKSHEAQTA